MHDVDRAAGPAGLDPDAPDPPETPETLGDQGPGPEPDGGTGGRPGRGAAEADFTDFVRSRSTALLRTAVLLTGGDRGHAEDLLQSVLERMYPRWRRIRESPEAYARRSLVHAAINRSRGRRRRPELPLLDHDARLPGADSGVEARDLVLRGLAALAPRQRAVLVLRYFDDLSEADTAAALDCSVGTVKSTASRALARLRELIPGDEPGRNGAIA